MKSLVTVTVLGSLLGVSPDKLGSWARRGLIPSEPYGKQRRFLVEDVKRALEARSWKGGPLLSPNSRKGRREGEEGSDARRCYLCGRSQPLDQFQPMQRTASNPRGLSYDCRDCRAERKRAARLAAGGMTRAVRAAQAKVNAEERRDAHAKDVAARKAARDARPRPSKAEISQRREARQRERYKSDPEFQARMKAKKIRRKRAQNGTKVVPVNRELVAERDGWRCGICAKLVTRNTWSLDHVVPLSKGGDHTYANVVLAHRSCNSSRGAGRRPVQPSLFGSLAPTPHPPNDLYAPATGDG